VTHGGRVSACFSPDATLIASAGGNTVKLWTTELHESPDSHSSEVNCMCFSEDGSLIASGSDDRTVKIWDAMDCSCLLTLTLSDDSDRIPSHFNSIVFSPNRTLVAAVGSLFIGVRIWDIESRKSCRMAMTGFPPFDVGQIKFSPDGSKLVSVSAQKIQVWDAETGSILAFRKNMDRSIQWVTFSDGGEILVQVAGGELERYKLRAVSASSPAIGPSEEMAETSSPSELELSTDNELEFTFGPSEGVAETSTPFELVLSTDDELTIQPPSPSYRLLREPCREWDDQWIVDCQGKRVFHWLDAEVSACHMKKVAVGTSTGRVTILDFSNVTH
jgi:WD40 repeat protein